MDAQAHAPSPFLPGTKVQFAWDSTSLGYLKTCPRLYQYIMVEGWGSREESVHLRFGVEYHKALQDYDLARAEEVEHEDAIREVLRALLERTFGWEVDTDTKAGRYKNRHTLVGLILDYLDQFKDDPAQTYIMKDGKPAVELSFRFELDWGPIGQEGIIWPNAFEDKDLQIAMRDAGDAAPKLAQPYLLCGHLDRVVDFAGHLFVMDRKTTYSTLSSNYFDQYAPSNQMTLYTLASQIILDSPIKGVIIDAAQILLEKPNRFVRGFTYRTPDQLDEWMADLGHWLRLAETYAIEGYWPQNDTSCDKFGGCRFREVCSKSPQVREQFLRSDFDQLPEEERWNPLKPR